MVQTTSGHTANVQRKWKRHKLCSTQDGGSVMSQESKRGKRKEVEGQDVIDFTQLMEAEVKEKKGRLTDVVMAELGEMAGVVEDHSYRGQ